MYWQGIISNTTLLNVCANLNKGVCILCNASMLLCGLGWYSFFIPLCRGISQRGGSRLAHDLFSCSQWINNGCYIFKWVKKIIHFCDAWNSQGRWNSDVSSVQSFSHVQLFVTPWTAARQASLSITNSWSSLKTHVHWVGDAMQPSHPLSSPSPPAFNLPSIRVFPNESVLCIRWPKYWSFSFSISPSNDVSVPK